MTTPQEKAQCVSWFIETKSDTQVQRNFRTKYGKVPPARSSIREWHKKFMDTGSVLHKGLGDLEHQKKTLKVCVWHLPDPNGAPPHWGLVVREFLDQTFPNRWIGRDGPIAWPPRSPDLTPLDFFM